jgi:DNA-binding PucR family transcriptional regulator
VVSVAAFAVADGRTAVPGPVAELIGLRAAGLDDDRARWAALGPIFYVVSGADDELVQLAEAAVADAARVFDVSVRAGIGRSRAEADGALRCAGGARGVVHIDDVRAQVVLAALRPLAEDVRHPHADRLDRLRALDARRDTGYIDTLLAWFDTGGSVSAAAARVHVHVNTFRYRLRRIAAVSGIDLDDPDERLALELQLRLSRQSRPGSH